MMNTKTIVALGFAGALLATSATPTLARGYHRSGPYAFAPTVMVPGARAYAYDPFMGEPRGYRMGRGWGYEAPRATVRPNQAWDPYALRWDGGQ